ncbi:MAG: choice-of-anchor Q domain-containing protein [Candidatus Limimorpha sp.]
MRISLLIILLSLVMTSMGQDTEVSGNQSGIWSGNITIVGDVIVPIGETLTIEPGTKVVSQGYWGIMVQGVLNAQGEKDNNIVFTVADTTGFANYESEQGGWKGIWISKCKEPIRFSYCDFSHGKTKREEDGGVMRVNYTDDIVISNCTFHNNISRRKGGAMYVEKSTINIDNCLVYENNGYPYDDYYTWGGGFQFHNSDVKIHDIIFHDNNAFSGYGGGMSIDSCDLELTNTVFYNNHATNAGALGIQRSSHLSVKVTNILAYNNWCIHYGGALAIATSDPELNNLTLVSNYCGGGGGGAMQMAFNSKPTLNNCIIYGNHAGHYLNKRYELDSIHEYYVGSQIWLWGSDCLPVFNNSDIQYGYDSINNNHLIPEENYNNMIETDPMFVDAENHDYRLTYGSPCINTGMEDVSGIFISETDIAGNPRIFNDRIDMGCYEWNNIGLFEHYQNNAAISIYPNPLNENSICNIRLNNESKVTISLLSINGKEINKKEYGMLDKGENAISLQPVFNNIEKDNNIYLLIISTQDNTYINKVIY